jgi:polysaccharide export outer membrane protein
MSVRPIVMGAARPSIHSHKQVLPGSLWRDIPGILAVLAVLVLCCQTARAQSQPTGPPAPAPEKVEAPKTPTNVPPDAPGVGVDPKTYVIGADDILNIKTWREPDFTLAVSVRPDGKITMPLIGDIQADGLTPDRLAAQLKQALSEYINKPDITVFVMQINSKRYSITGGVNRPGTFPMIAPVRVFDALSGAGGFRDFANTKDIIIARGNKRLHFNYNEVLKGKKLEQNIFLENGDTIIVKQ